MKRSGDTPQALSLQRTANVLGGLVVVAILAMVACFWVVNHYAAHDREYISRSERIGVLSQAIAKNASEAANGKTDAFAQLDDAYVELLGHLAVLQDGDSVSGLPPTAAYSERAHTALERTIRPWIEVEANVQAILSRREMVITVNELAEEFRIALPRVQNGLAQLSDRLVAVRAHPAQVQAAGLGQLQVERVSRHLGELLRGGLGNITAADRLGVAAGELAQTLEALGSGSSALSVPAITDGQARQILAQVHETYGNIESEMVEMLASSPEMFRVRNASDAIFMNSDLVPFSANHLRDTYASLEAERLVKVWHGFAFGALALILLIARGALTRMIGAREVAAKEAEKARVDDESRRNQEAILNLLDEIEGLKEGDLTVQASVGEEITGAIGDAFNDATDALRNLVTTINETSVQVSSAAQQTQATAMHLAEASDHQAHQITAASAAVNEMAVSIDQVSKNANESSQVAQQSVDLALKGAETVRRTIDGMDAIREQIQETSKRIKRLGESSQEIGNIVELINDIADQTNILALNASIQAAMAGESGRGFAVVADEVQRLAERSGNATKQIEALVKTIQTDTNEAVISMEQSTAGVVAGASLAEDAGEALREIESVSQQLAGLIQNISEAARQQANAAANVSDTMNVIQEITSQTSAGTNETATSIGNLADLANDLRNSVAGFKLPE